MRQGSKKAKSKQQQQLSERLLLLHFPILTGIGVILVAAAIGCYVYGVFAPFMEVDKFWIFHNIVSLYSSIVALYTTKNYFLCIVIFVFSIIVPLIKFLLLAYTSLIAKPSHAHKVLDLVEKIGKWSMLDVFVVAVIVVSIKMGAIVSVSIHVGVLFFSIAIIVTAILVRYFNFLCVLAERRRHTTLVELLHVVKDEKSKTGSS